MQQQIQYVGKAGLAQDKLIYVDTQLNCLPVMHAINSLWASTPNRDIAQRIGPRQRKPIINEIINCTPRSARRRQMYENNGIEKGAEL